MVNMNLRVALLLACVASYGFAQAEPIPPVPAQPPPAAAQTDNELHEMPGVKISEPGWVSRCVGESRNGPFRCSMEETLVLASTGQLVAAIVVKVQPGDHDLMMVIRVPGGLYIPAGLKLQVDGGKAQMLSLETCDQQSCYAEMQVSADLIAALKTGKKLSITCQNATRKLFVLPMSLGSFADVLQRIE